MFGTALLVALGRFTSNGSYRCGMICGVRLVVVRVVCVVVRCGAGDGVVVGLCRSSAAVGGGVVMW